jgi:hypothetical protein
VIVTLWIEKTWKWIPVVVRGRSSRSIVFHWGCLTLFLSTRSWALHLIPSKEEIEAQMKRQERIIARAVSQITKLAIAPAPPPRVDPANEKPN